MTNSNRTEMSNTDPVHLGSFTWSVQDEDELVHRYPPKWTHPMVVTSIPTPPGTKHDGSVTASRWKQTGMPSTLKATINVHAVAVFFTYDIPNEDSIHWHLNFADPYLFWYVPLLAQDELQITEHPCLASLGIEDAESHGIAGLNRLTDENGKATPVLVHNAPRRCALNLDTSRGLLFAMTSAEDQVCRSNTTPQIPPTHTNILALAALSPSHGRYTTAQIHQILLTAYTGFRAMVLESRRASSTPTQVVLHTGHWGCGAFGGDKGLMCAIQLLAAGMAEVDQVYFYHGENDKAALEHGMQVAQLLSGVSVETAIEKLAHAGYQWTNNVPSPENCLLKQHHGWKKWFRFHGELNLAGLLRTKWFA